MKEEIEIFNYLLETGCCKSCCLRYICKKSSDLEDVENYFQKVTKDAHNLLNIELNLVASIL